MPEPSECAEFAAERLSALGREYALVGALAAATYRTSRRLTTDADFLIDSIQGVRESFTDAGLDVAVHEDEGEPYLVVIRGRDVAIDLMVATVEYQRVALSRAVDHVITVEDVIVHKLIAWRPRDRDDIQAILEAGHQLDEAYIEEWADAWEIRDRWAEARASR